MVSKAHNEVLRAADVRRWVWHELGRRYDLLVPNYTPAGYGFECDMFGITRNGTGHEFEVKLSVSDFKADAKKKVGGRFKCDLLAAGCPPCPSVFYYVVPKGLLCLDMVPRWAGLIEVSGRPSNVSASAFDRVKLAPVLHRGKVDPVVRAHMLGVCYWRYWQKTITLDRVRAGRIK